MSTPFRHPSKPMSISLERLQELDRAPAGTYFGSGKIDGRRRYCIRENGVWTYRAKNRGDALAMPAELTDELECLPWPVDVTLDAEFAGLRQVGDRKSLWIFDILQHDKDSMFNVPFKTRLSVMNDLRRYLFCEIDEKCIIEPLHPSVHWLDYIPNPGLQDLFALQLGSEMSEGIVVQTANGTIRGSYSESVESPFTYKLKFDRVAEKGR